MQNTDHHSSNVVTRCGCILLAKTHVKVNYFIYCYKLASCMHVVFIGGKLAWNWGGPYEVVEQTKRGTYRLKNTKGTVLKAAINSNGLKLHYEGNNNN